MEEGKLRIRTTALGADTAEFRSIVQYIKYECNIKKEKINKGNQTVVLICSLLPIIGFGIQEIHDPLGVPQQEVQQSCTVLFWVYLNEHLFPLYVLHCRFLKIR